MSEFVIVTAATKKADLLKSASERGVPGIEELSKIATSKQAIADAINAHTGAIAPATTNDNGPSDSGVLVADNVCPNPSCGASKFDGEECGECGYKSSEIVRQFTIV